MKHKKKIISARGWAVISPRNKILPETVCVDKQSAEHLLVGITLSPLKEYGHKVRPVRITCEVPDV